MDMLISLEFSNTVFEDTGTWTCIVTVAAFNVTDSSSESEIIPSVKIGEVIFNISLIVLGEQIKLFLHQYCFPLILIYIFACSCSWHPT